MRVLLDTHVWLWMQSEPERIGTALDILTDGRNELNIDRSILEAASMLGTPRWRMACEVIVPAAAPMIFTGIRLSLQASWTTLVAAELVGALAGIGFVLNMAQQDIYPGMILVGMLTVGVLGWATTWVLGVVERRALAWNTAARD